MNEDYQLWKLWWYMALWGMPAPMRMLALDVARANRFKGKIEFIGI